MSNLHSAVSVLREEAHQLEATLMKVRGAIAALTETEPAEATTVPDPAKIKTKRKRKPLTAAQKRAISRRMKASWAKRKRQAA